MTEKETTLEVLSHALNAMPFLEGWMVLAGDFGRKFAIIFRAKDKDFQTNWFSLRGGIDQALQQIKDIVQSI